MTLRIIMKNVQSIQRYSFRQHRFYGLWSSERPPTSVGVNKKVLTARTVFQLVVSLGSSFCIVFMGFWAGSGLNWPNFCPGPPPDSSPEPKIRFKNWFFSHQAQLKPGFEKMKIKLYIIIYYLGFQLFILRRLVMTKLVYI